MAVLHAFAKPADFKFPQEKVGRTVGGVTSVEGQLVNSQAPDIAIYFYPHDLHHSGVNSLRVCICTGPLETCNQTCLDSVDPQ